MLACEKFGFKFQELVDCCSSLKPVPGRLEFIGKTKKGALVYIDFAHTPDALEQSLIALKEQFKCEIIIVFGCGGEIDKKKRFTMGKIAGKYCRKIF